MWEFDEVYTAPDGGYRDATDYYEKSAARNGLASITIPTLIMASQDDPFIPYDIFTEPSLHSNPWIQLLAPPHGGHCGFFQRSHPHEDPFWAENRIIDLSEYMKSLRTNPSVTPPDRSNFRARNGKLQISVPPCKDCSCDTWTKCVRTHTIFPRT
jgi:hypothetical protein